MKPTLLSMVLLLSSLAHAAALGPSNPPPGVASEAWGKMTGRADWVARSVAKLAPGANKECVYAVVLELLGEVEVAWSQDEKGRGQGTKRSVAKGREAAFSDALKKNSLDSCGGGGGGSTALVESLKGVLRFTADQEGWDVANHEKLKREVVRAAQGLVGMGLFAPAAGGAAVPAGVPLPILNPELFMPRERNDGT
jgi:hypothetical protein